LVGFILVFQPTVSATGRKPAEKTNSKWSHPSLSNIDLFQTGNQDAAPEDGEGLNTAEAEDVLEETVIVEAELDPDSTEVSILINVLGSSKCQLMLIP